VAHDCLRQRIMLSHEGGAEGVPADQVISAILEQVAVA